MAARARPLSCEAAHSPRTRGSGALLPHTIAAALRLPDRFTHSRLDVLVDQLRDRHLLLILDTCEHLLGACAGLIAALLAPCPKMQVLATSREPLRVPGEAVLAVRPLRLADAMKLFFLRAAQAGVEIPAQSRAAVASVCVQLDKLPLAIELAAAELGALSKGRPNSSAAGTPRRCCCAVVLKAVVRKAAARTCAPRRSSSRTPRRRSGCSTWPTGGAGGA